eukprot:9299714-Pyramimonas_sp.AAC.1
MNFPKGPTQAPVALRVIPGGGLAFSPGRHTATWHTPSRNMPSLLRHMSLLLRKGAKLQAPAALLVIPWTYTYYYDGGYHHARSGYHHARSGYHHVLSGYCHARSGYHHARSGYHHAR